MRDRAENIRGSVEYALDILLDRHIALHCNRLAPGLLYGLDNTSRGISIGLGTAWDIVPARAGQFRAGGTDTADAAGDQQNGSRHGLLPYFPLRSNTNMRGGANT